MNTTVLDLFFPGFIAKYGADRFIDVEYDVRALTNFTAKENSKTMSFNADVGVRFWVETANGTNETAIDITLEGLYFEFTAIIDGMAVKPNVTDASLRDIKVVSSTIGTLNMTMLEALLDQGLDEGRAPFNTFIQSKSLIIPDTIFGLFGLSDLILKYHNGYLEAGLTPHFLPLPSDRTPYEAPVYDYSHFNQVIDISESG